MLRRIVQACFLITGGTLGLFLLPDFFNLVLSNNIPLINNPYVSVILGALIFYLITFWAIDHVVNFIKWIEESLVRAPITDIISGSVGLGFGLIVAFLIGYALSAITMPIIEYCRTDIIDIIIWLLRFSSWF